MLPASSAGGSSSSGGGSPASPSNSGFNEPLFSRLKLPDELLARRIKDAQAADKNTVQHDLVSLAALSLSSPGIDNLALAAHHRIIQPDG